MSILIREDKGHLSEIDLISIEKGVAELGIHSLRFSAFLTEEQKQENSRIFDTLTSTEWNARCELHRQEVGSIIEKVIDVLNSNFMVYQYKNKEVNYSKDDWDLFFWCNTGDMSYVTLSSNDKRSNEQQMKSMSVVLEFLKSIDCGGVDVAIQYTVKYNQEKVNTIRLEQYQKVGNKPIEFWGEAGKIKEVGKTYEGKTVYGFFKKGASKNYRQVSDSTFLQMAFNS